VLGLGWRLCALGAFALRMSLWIEFPENWSEVLSSETGLRFFLDVAQRLGVFLTFLREGERKRDTSLGRRSLTLRRISQIASSRYAT
jgi:hypothetical protein